MKNYLFLISIIFLFSCEKDDVGPNLKEFGFLEKYLKNNPEISIIKTNQSNIVYVNGRATDRGYIFRPLADLKLTSFGGRIAEHGIYKFEIFKLDEWILPIDTLLLDSINITNTSTFQYKNTDREILLLKNERYMIRYFNESHNSVYDAGLGWSQNDTINHIKFPLTIDDIEIEVPFYTYHTKYNGEYWLTDWGTFNFGILRGLVDFRYEIAK